MILLSQSISSILLASSFLFTRACGEREREIIGYRTLSSEADNSNDYERRYRNAEYDEEATTAQIGAGFYTFNEPAGWQARGNEWYCVLEADSELLKKISKVWIPKSYTKSTGDGETQLWHRDEETLLEYIQSIVPESDPKKALRFSAIPSVPGKVQMLIPSETIEDELEIWSQCYETEKELRSNTERCLYEGKGRELVSALVRLVAFVAFVGFVAFVALVAFEVFVAPVLWNGIAPEGASASVKMDHHQHQHQHRCKKFRSS
ncbi:uncharacterized protein L3040_008362 [Drepanopeziza brunnea f. sp. 'multigermtubi']|uniref:uncharacterized protein n=1 Tax=Drepanopeziza brunnea f. sp. 'multigermtubi' TaxID=698441 RepID=UPI00238E60AF|nr:hypothetical protein L3040_008362 [Drepanopeziza brunnea f. sp. 'multigermtubi']